MGQFNENVSANVMTNDVTGAVENIHQISHADTMLH